MIKTTEAFLRSFCYLASSKTVIVTKCNGGKKAGFSPAQGPRFLVQSLSANWCQEPPCALDAAPELWWDKKFMLTWILQCSYDSFTHLHMAYLTLMLSLYTFSTSAGGFSVTYLRAVSINNLPQIYSGLQPLSWRPTVFMNTCSGELNSGVWLGAPVLLLEIWSDQEVYTGHKTYNGLFTNPWQVYGGQNPSPGDLPRSPNLS